MDLSLEWLPLLIVFLLPGFVAFYLGQYLKPGREREFSSFELGLISLAYSLVISCIEALLFVLVLPSLGVNLGKLIQDPFQDTLAAYPGQVTLGLTIWIAVGLGFGYLVGVNNPIFNRPVQSRLAKLGIRKSDIWFNVFNTKIHEGVQILVHMKNGDIYAGYLGEYDLFPDDNGNREFVVMGVHFRPGPQTTMLAHDKGSKFGRNSAALLNTRDADAIDILFESSSK